MKILGRILKYLNKRATPTEALVIAPRQLSGRWQRVINEDDIILGYTFTCLCGETKKYRANESAVDAVHRCLCGRDFNLKQSLMLTGADTKLVKREKPQRTTQTVGDEPIAELYLWSGRQDAARSRAFDAGDPGYSGMFGERHT